MDTKDKILDNNSMSQLDYDKLLKDYISKINTGEYKNLHGSDGTVYFVDKDFVVKEYDKINDKDPYLLDNIFEYYADEQKGFSEKGYNIAKIFAYLRDCGSGLRQRFYLLEERVKGKNPVYFLNLEDSYYDIFDKEYSKEEFKQIINNIECNLPAFERIFNNYTEYFNSSNVLLENLSIDVIESFIFEQLEMYYGEYSYPDLFSVNTFITEDKITTIDNHMSYREFDEYMPLNNDSIIRADLAYHILNFARDNKSVTLSNDQLSKMSPESAKHFSELIEYNRRLCDSLLKKFAVAMVNVVGKVVLPKNKYDALGEEISKVVSDENVVAEILKNIERGE